MGAPCFASWPGPRRAGRQGRARRGPGSGGSAAWRLDQKTAQLGNGSAQLTGNTLREACSHAHSRYLHKQHDG